MAEARLRALRGRQLLFSRTSPLFAELTPLIEAQNRRTLVLWALDLAQETVEHLETRHPQERAPRGALEAAWAWASGGIRMPAARRAILDCHARAKRFDDPADIALCHAVAQGCSVVHTPGHALGLPLYELTALVRERGVDGSREAVEQRCRTYAVRLLDWQRRERDDPGPWARFLKP